MEAKSLELEALQRWLVRHAAVVLRGPPGDGHMGAVEQRMAAGTLRARLSVEAERG